MAFRSKLLRFRPIRRFTLAFLSRRRNQSLPNPAPSPSPSPPPSPPNPAAVYPRPPGSFALPLISGLTSEEILEVNRSLESFYRSYVPPDSHKTSALALSRKFRKLLKSHYPHATVRLFGSFKSRTAIMRSNVNISVNMLGDEEDEEAVASVLRLDEDTLVYSVVAGNGIFGTHGSLNFCVSLNKLRATYAAKFIRAIVMTSQVAREMLLLLNYFATVHDLNNVNDGGLASVGFSYMGILVMQKMHVVPKFLDKEIEAGDFSQESGRFRDISGTFIGCSSKLDTNLVNLLHEVFYYFGNEFDYSEHAVSLRAEGFVRKDTEDPLCIIDPFGGYGNVAGNVESHTLANIQFAFARAADLLAEGSQVQNVFRSQFGSAKDPKPM